MMFENKKDKRSNEQIKKDYLVNNNVRTVDNPVTSAPANVNVASNVNANNSENVVNNQPNNSEISNKNAEEFMNMFK